MRHLQRGAAQVSMIWMILTLVIMLIAILFGYLQMQQVSDVEAQLTTASNGQSESENRFNDVTDRMRTLSQVVGFTGEGGTGMSSADAVRQSVTESTAAFPSAGTATTLQSALAAGVSDYSAVTSAKAALESQVAQLANDLAARQRETTAALREKDSRITELERQIEDAGSQHIAQVTDLERQRDALRDQVRDNDRQVSELRTRLDDQRRQFAANLQDTQARNSILSERLNTVSRREDTPDGSVLSVSPELGMAYIDLGRLDRIRPGMEFEVRDGATKQRKGRLRVREVQDRRSSADIVSQADRFDPIGPDDLILNGLYDPQRVPVAVLFGNGFGRYTEDDMRNLLTEVGIRVQTEVDREVDYLVLGTPFFDQETGDLVPWSSQDVYKEADASAVQVVPYRDAMAWLGL